MGAVPEGFGIRAAEFDVDRPVAAFVPTEQVSTHDFISGDEVDEVACCE